MPPCSVSWWPIPPELVLHLAAQPLVRRTYAEPTANWATHLMGTIHLLEALRRLEAPCTTVLITTDNGYRNKEWLYGNRETIPSAAMTPTAAAARGRQPAEPEPHLRVARAGKVIGWGDWAADQIVSDATRAIGRGEPIGGRNAALAARAEAAQRLPVDSGDP